MHVRCSLIEIHITNGLLTVNAKKKRCLTTTANRGGGLEKRGEAVNMKGETRGVKPHGCKIKVKAVRLCYS